LDRRHWLTRAKEMRALAEGLADETTKASMLRIAKEYEKQAKRAATYKRRKNG
jgi:hypothetical protein